MPIELFVQVVVEAIVVGCFLPFGFLVLSLLCVSFLTNSLLSLLQIKYPQEANQI
jgi:hypothetical protein